MNLKLDNTLFPLIKDLRDLELLESMHILSYYQKIFLFEK